MGPIESGNHTAVAREGFTLFLIGVRVNSWIRPRGWWWTGRAFNGMLAELGAERERGLLHARTLLGARGITSVQYWESTEALLRYAHERLHKDAWRTYNRTKDGSAGIWHETYEIGAPQSENSAGFEAFYGDMPVTGLGRALGTRPLTGATRKAADRLLRGGRTR